MQPCAIQHTHTHNNNHTHIHHPSVNGDKVDIQHDSNGGHTEIVHHADGTTETFRYNSHDSLIAVQSQDGNWHGMGLDVSRDIKPELDIIW